MKKLNAINYMRGIGMLGVVGIHMGSVYLSLNNSANIHLLAIYEILTRFSVPLFFFISAFGLFYNEDFKKEFSYKKFLTKRFKTVGIPYFAWSLFYLIAYGMFYHYWGFLYPFHLIYILFYGLACYQLYFMVILFWFYILQPIWRYIIPRLSVKGLIVLFIFQIGFNYYSSYEINIYAFDNSIFKPLVEYRLNYLILHYIFIFLLGGYVAIHYEKLKITLKNNLNSLRISALITAILLLSHYYYLIYRLGYISEGAINTAHQLSPLGIFYTLAMSLYLLAECEDGFLAKHFIKLQNLLGDNSYFIYLFHPMMIIILKALFLKLGIIFTAEVSILFAIILVIATLSTGVILKKLSQKYCNIINELTIGLYQK